MLVRCRGPKIMKITRPEAQAQTGFAVVPDPVQPLRLKDMTSQHGKKPLGRRSPDTAFNRQTVLSINSPVAFSLASFLRFVPKNLDAGASLWCALLLTSSVIAGRHSSRISTVRWLLCSAAAQDGSTGARSRWSTWPTVFAIPLLAMGMAASFLNCCRQGIIRRGQRLRACRGKAAPPFTSKLEGPQSSISSSRCPGPRETVTVSGAPQLVETQPSAMSAVIDERAIEGLPLNGRRFTDLAFACSGRDSGSARAHVFLQRRFGLWRSAWLSVQLSRRWGTRIYDVWPFFFPAPADPRTSVASCRDPEPGDWASLLEIRRGRSHDAELLFAAGGTRPQCDRPTPPLCLLLAG